MYTFAFILIFVSLALGFLAAWIWAFRFGLRWAGAANVTWKRTGLALAAYFAFAVIASLALGFLEQAFPNWTAVITVAGWLIGIPCLAGAAMAVFKLRPGRALQSTLPSLLVTAASAALPIFVLRPFVVEAFTTPTNSMAPSLVGLHRVAKCPKCGSPAYGSAEGSPRGLMMICDRFHVSRIDADNSPVLPSMRFAVGKLLAPKRWDMMAFRHPEDPSTIYVMRVVGLPGEKIVIQDGAVWADGQRLTMPEDLEGLEYLDRIPGFPGLSSGTAEDPAPLGSDEYFVLGDFSARAKDSRLWQDGAPGHPPYAVPRSHVYGVVTTVYWPPSRWRAIH